MTRQMKKTKFFISKVQLFIQDEQDEDEMTKSVFKERYQANKIWNWKIIIQKWANQILSNIYQKVLENDKKIEFEIQTKKISSPDAIMKGIKQYLVQILVSRTY